MLGILSIIFLLLILFTSLFFLYYYRFMPNKKKSVKIQSTVKKTQNEPVISSKKSKKQKKNQKSPVDDKINVDEINESTLLNVEDSPKKDVVIHEDPDTELEIVEVIHQTQELGCHSYLSENKDTPPLEDKNVININQLTQQINVFEIENHELNKKLEEATENCLLHKQEADSLKEENKNMKSKISKLEHSQNKNEEKYKKTEKSLTDSLSKTAELEKNLAKMNAEHAEVKNNLTSLTGRLNKTESDLSCEQEKQAKSQIEKENMLKKYEELFAKCKIDETSHKEMYRRYEEKIGQLDIEKRQMSDDFANTRKLITEKEDQIKQLHSDLSATTALFEEIKEDNLTISQRYNGLCEELKTNVALLESSETERARLSGHIEHLKPELVSKAEIEIKLQEKLLESEKKDSIIDDLRHSVSVLKNEIENISQGIILKNDELSIDLMNLKQQLEMKNADLAAVEDANIALITEIKTLNTNVHHKDVEFETKFLELHQELKGKDLDLTVLQDHKLELLKQIDHLKQDIGEKNEELLKKNEEILNTSEFIKQREEVTRQLLFEKGNFQSKLDNLKKELYIREEKWTQANEELNMIRSELISSENEKTIFQESIGNLQKQVHEINVERATLEKLVGKKDEEIHEISQVHKEMKDRIEELEKKQTIHDDVEEVIIETRQKSELQTANLCLSDDSSSSAKDMQSHITKLETELLVLQRKYFDLKNSNLAGSAEDHHLADRPAPHIVYHQSETVSIPPVVDKHSANLFDAEAEKSSETYTHLLESIEKLNAEISQQRLKNQTLDKEMSNKNVEVNALKLCLGGIDSSLLVIGDLALDMQKSFNDSSSERVRLQTEYSQLLERHNVVNANYEALVRDFNTLRDSEPSRRNETDDTTVRTLETQLKKLKEENQQLLAQLENYRETLQKTEFCLQNIQASVDQEESNWKNCLKSSEQEQERLEQKIKELLTQIDDLRSKKDSESPFLVTVSDDAPPVLNGSLSSETKKKKKRKNKKKKNKARVTATQP